MGFHFEHKATGTYLVYELSKTDELDTLGLCLLAENTICGVAPASFQCTGTDGTIEYDIPSKVTLSKLFDDVINKKKLIAFLSGIVDGFLEAERLLINTNHLVLDPDYIFADDTTGETVLICLPVTNRPRRFAGLGALISHLIFTMRFDLTENCAHVAEIMNYINHHPVFSAAEFKALLENLSEVACSAKRKASAEPEPQPLYQTLLEGLQNMRSHIPCPDDSKETVNEVLHQILLDNPQLCQFEGLWRWDNGVIPTYTLHSRQQKQLMHQAERLVDELRIPHQASAPEKAEQVYLWLSENVTYDRDAPHSQSAYGALVERQALCKGIAKAFQLLMGMLQVPCVLVEGSLDGTTKHVWNMYLDDQWLHCDVTMSYPRFQSWNRTGDPLAYLAMSTQDILRTHRIWSNDQPPVPADGNDTFFQSLSHSRRKQPHAPLKQLPPQMAQYCIGQPEYIASGSVSDVYGVSPSVVIKQIPCGLDSGKLYYAMRECAILQRIKDCPATVRLLDFDIARTNEGFTVFIAQERFSSLDEICRRIRPSLRVALNGAITACVGLEQCLSKGVAHLDIQPGNLLMTSDGAVRLTDFSSALPVEELKNEQRLRGTPAYMAPEVKNSHQYSEASEVYALGIVLFCLLSNGNLPFSDQYPMEKAVEARMAGRPVTLRQDLDRRIRACVEKACAFRAADRFQTVKQFRLALEELVNRVPDLDRPACPSDPARTSAVFPRHQCADRIATSVCFNDSVNHTVMCADSFGETTVLAPPMAQPAAPAQPAAAPVYATPVPPPFLRREPVQISTVQFSAVAPQTAIKGEYTLVQLYMYEQAFRSAVEEALQMADAPMQEKKTGFYQVKDQTRVTVVLSSPDVEILDDTAEEIWSGGYLVFDFAVDVPPNCAKRQALLKANVYFDGIPATRLIMTLKLQSQHDQRLELLRADVLSAFVSYASQDRSRVGALVQGMMKARPDMDIFFDINSLRSGDNWETTLRSEIEKRDTLFLCWSKNAQSSQWVDKEWRYALANKGIEAIEPIPIDPPDICPPPDELKSKHFNDSLLYIINKP